MRRSLEKSELDVRASLGMLRTVKSAHLLKVICLVLGFHSLKNALGEAMPQTQLVYFGTYTGAKSEGIYVAEFDSAAGRLGAARLAAKSRNPTFLAVDTNRLTLYAVNEVADFGGTNSGAVSSFKINPATGELRFINMEASGGSGPCHIAIAQKGRCVIVANYGSGSIAVLPIEANGALTPVLSSIQHQGSSVNPRRQEGPHAHFVTWSPSNGRVFACDLGLDKVLIYRLDPDQLSLSANEPPSFQVKPGSGPRHLAFNPGGTFAYILNELSSTLTCCSYEPNNGNLNEIQTISTLPHDFRGSSTCAEIQMHPSGKFLYGANRGADTIAVFSIDDRTGKVKLVQNESTKGKTPRHFTLDPSSHWLLAENQDSDSVVVFSADANTGRLRSTGQSQPVGAPVCAVFIPKR